MLSKVKVSKEVAYGVLLFLFFAFIFSFFRHNFYAFNTWCFAITGEMQQVKFSEEDGDFPPTGGDQQKKTAAAKANTAPAAKAPDSDKPVRTNLPQTAQPKIQILPSISEVDESKLPVFPDLRNYSGTEWKDEKTVVKMATDGQSLYVSILCSDADPKNLVTKYSETEGDGNAWKDDSIEFFLMKDKDADHYYQLVASASGLSHIYYLKIPDSAPISYASDTTPADFKKPFIRSEKCPEGFKVTMEIDLQGFGFDKLDDGKEILMQVARNYRDNADPKSAKLQLFPTFIYCDNRHGPQHHDRRGFASAKAVK